MKDLMNKKKLFSILPPVLLLILAILMVVVQFPDRFHAINDDMVIRDILSGAYTGTPESRNIQMLYPLSLVLSIFYRIFPRTAVYDLYLSICMWGSLFVIMRFFFSYFPLKLSTSIPSAGKNNSNAVSQLSGLILPSACSIAVFLTVYRYMINPHYSVAASLMTAAGSLLCLGSLDSAINDQTPAPSPSSTGKSPEEPLLSNINIPGIILIFTGFCTRSEMCLFLLPLTFMAAIFISAEKLLKSSGHLRGQHPLVSEKIPADRKNIASEAKTIMIRLSFLLIPVAAGLLLLTLLDLAAYSSPEWSNFRRLFDKRTSVYDFYGVPEFEEAEDFYVSQGLSEAEEELLHNYNYNLSEKINADMMDALAEYQSTRNKEHGGNSFFLISPGEALASYKRFLTLHAPWDDLWSLDINAQSMVIYLLYALWLLALFLNKSPTCLIFPPLFFLGRSVLWLYLAFKNRMPDRITLGLLLTEAVIIIYFILKSGSDIALKEHTSNSSSFGDHSFDNSSLDNSSLDDSSLDDSSLDDSSLDDSSLDDSSFDDSSFDDSSFDNSSLDNSSLDNSSLDNSSLDKDPSGRAWRYTSIAISLIITVICIFALSIESSYYRSTYAERWQIQAEYDALNYYCLEHPDNFYALDVYSMVGYSGHFMDSDNDLKNFDLCGGWCGKSPLYLSKLKNFNASSMGDDLLKNHNFFFVAKSLEDISWINALYREWGEAVSVETVDKICPGSEEIFTVYRIHPID